MAVFAVLTDQLFFGGHVACNSTLALLCHLDTLLYIRTAVNQKAACSLFVKSVGLKTSLDNFHGFTRVIRVLRSW